MSIEEEIKLLAEQIKTLERKFCRLEGVLWDYANEAKQPLLKLEEHTCDQ